MLTVTTSLSQAFESQLSLRNIPNQQRRDFHKWLRFYMNFCNKYTLDLKLTASFAEFDEKLQSKGQSDAQRMEARRSIAIYYRLIGTLQSPPAPSGNSTTKTANNTLPSTPSGTPHSDAFSQFGLPSTKREMPLFSVTTQPLTLTGASWEAVYERLQAAIKVRHYSNKTWQAFTGQRRYSHHSGIAWPQRFENDDDLHPHGAQCDD